MKRMSAVSRGFGRVDVMLAVAFAGLLAGAGCMHLRTAERGSDRFRCLSNLKQVGTGIQLWLHDHEDRLPWQVASADGGSRGLERASDHFFRMSHFLPSPAVLSCPGLGKYRPPASSWAAFSDRHLSYGLNCDAPVALAGEAGRPASPLLSMMIVDMDIEGGREGSCVNCPGKVMDVPMGPDIPIRWSRTNHVDYGNVLWSDGTVSGVPSVRKLDWVAPGKEQGGSVHFLLPR